MLTTLEAARMCCCSEMDEVQDKIDEQLQIIQEQRQGIHDDLVALLEDAKRKLGVV